jgi:cytochrome P450
LLSDPDLIEQVLVTDNRNFVKPYIYQFLRPALGNGLLLSEGDFWLRQRKLMQPAFLRQRIETYGTAMVSHTQRMLARWRDGETRDLHADMMQLTQAIVAQALLDVDVADASTGVAEALECIMEDFSYRFESVFPVPLWIPVPRNRRLMRAVQLLDRIIERIIQQRRSASEDRGDLLSRLMQAQDEERGGGMTNRQLRDEVMTLYLAGHETTANALSWCWYLLGQHPEVEAKLHAELRDVLGDRAPTVADLPRLVYTERIILESMRLYPPVYAFGRRPIADCTLGGYAIRAGTTIMISQWIVHRDPRHFAEPERFDPDRWANDLQKRLPKYAYFPFGGGPRVCIGNTFAMMEAVLVLATIASQFRIRLDPAHAVVPWPSITLRPLRGIKAQMALTTRQPVGSVAGGTQDA